MGSGPCGLRLQALWQPTCQCSLTPTGVPQAGVPSHSAPAAARRAERKKTGNLFTHLGGQRPRSDGLGVPECVLWGAKSQAQLEATDTKVQAFTTTGRGRTPIITRASTDTSQKHYLVPGTWALWPKSWQANWSQGLQTQQHAYALRSMEARKRNRQSRKHDMHMGCVQARR